MKRKITLQHSAVLLLTLLLSAYTANAQDRIFTYTYQSSTLNKGQREIEIWNTLHSGRNDYYRGLKSRIEFEMGLASKLQTSFYLNFSSSTSGLVVPGESSERMLSSNYEFGFSNEWKLKLSDPSANKLGSAIYAELEISPSEMALETKLILDKQYDKFYHAINITMEPEWEAEAGTDEILQEFEFEFGLNYGLAWNINTHWNAGVELMNINKYAMDEHLEYAAVFIGPALSYSTEKFWINFTMMPQLPSLYQKDKNAESSLIFDGHEKIEARLLFSFNL